MDSVKKYNTCWRECGKRGTPKHYQGQCKMVQMCWKTIWPFLNMLNIDHITVILFLGT